MVANLFATRGAVADYPLVAATDPGLKPDLRVNCE
jgi:hypothetical protein